jgi:hypothetical protein
MITAATSSSSSNAAGAVVLVLVLIVFGIGLYFLPSMIAKQRNHHQFKMILVLNIFLGWTFIGWVVCLAMSLSATQAGGSPVASVAGPQAAAPPGWYSAPTPDNPGAVRWWDGTRWTDHTHQGSSAPPSA